MTEESLFGWDLTFKTIEKDVKQKSDIIIAFIHWSLMRRGFRNIGIGDELVVSGNEERSELLPSGWNEKKNYTLRYILNNKVFILHGLSSDGNLIINLMRSEDLEVSSIALNVEDLVQEINGSIEKLIPNFKDLMFNIKRDLIDVITEKTTNTIETQTSNSSDRRSNSPSSSRAVRPNSNLWEPPSSNLRNVGRADLDPFAPGGGGMLFNPLQPNRDIENPGLGIPGGLPRGAVPPGARFDPFGPPGVGPMPGRRRPPPDADHLPPPGFDDNMFI